MPLIWNDELLGVLKVENPYVDIEVKPEGGEANVDVDKQAIGDMTTRTLKRDSRSFSEFDLMQCDMIARAIAFVLSRRPRTDRQVFISYSRRDAEAKRTLSFCE